MYNCEDNPDQLAEMFQSISRHMCGEHVFPTNTYYRECLHLEFQSCPQHGYLDPKDPCIAKVAEVIESLIVQLVGDHSVLIRPVYTGPADQLNSKVFKIFYTEAIFLGRKLQETRIRLSVLDHNVNRGYVYEDDAMTQAKSHIINSKFNPVDTGVNVRKPPTYKHCNIIHEVTYRIFLQQQEPLTAADYRHLCQHVKQHVVCLSYVKLASHNTKFK